MTKFIIGLLLGLILGIGGTAAFLITAGGGDYLVSTSPRVRELETSLKQADQEREWLRGQLRDSNEILVKLESRFVALATRFEDLGSQAATLLGAPPATTEPGAAKPTVAADTTSAKHGADETHASPTAEPSPTPAESGLTSADEDAPVGPQQDATATAPDDAGTPTPRAQESPKADSGEDDEPVASPGEG